MLFPIDSVDRESSVWQEPSYPDGALSGKVNLSASSEDVGKEAASAWVST